MGEQDRPIPGNLRKSLCPGMSSARRPAIDTYVIVKIGLAVQLKGVAAEAEILKYVKT
jgi:hypothetical protein